MHDDYSRTERAKRAAQRVARGAGDIVDYLCVLCPLCAYWVAVKIAEGWLKFRAALSDRRSRWRVVPKRNGIVQQYTDLELIIRTGGSFGGQRAVFITDLARMENELLVLREADATRRREEVRRTSNRRHEAVAATKRKLDEQDGCDKRD